MKRVWEMLSQLFVMIYTLSIYPSEHKQLRQHLPNLFCTGEHIILWLVQGWFRVLYWHMIYQPVLELFGVLFCHAGTAHRFHPSPQTFSFFAEFCNFFMNLYKYIIPWGAVKRLVIIIYFIQNMFWNMSFLHNKKRVKYLCFELNRNFKKVGALNGLAISGGTKVFFLNSRANKRGEKQGH